MGSLSGFRGEGGNWGGFEGNLGVPWGLRGMWWVSGSILRPVRWFWKEFGGVDLMCPGVKGKCRGFWRET